MHDPAAINDLVPVLRSARGKPTDDKITMATTDMHHMVCYLLFGWEAVGHQHSGDVAELAKIFHPSSLNWLDCYGQDEQGNPVPPRLSEMTDSQMCGVWWAWVSGKRLADGNRMILPKSFGRMIKEIGNLRKVESSSQVYAMLHRLTRTHDHPDAGMWELIKFRLGKLGETLVLDETTLHHSLVVSQAREIMGRGMDWFHQQVDDMYAKQHRAQMLKFL